MALEKIVEELSAIERTALALLEEKPLAFARLKEKTDLNEDSLRRAFAWLQEKGLAKISEDKTVLLALTDKGKEAAEKGLAERHFMEKLKQLGGQAQLQELKKVTGLGAEFNKALGLAKENAWVAIKKKEGGVTLELTGLEKEFLSGFSPAEKLLEKASLTQVELGDLDAEEKKAFAGLRQRNLLETRDSVARAVSITRQGLAARKLMGKQKDVINILSKDVLQGGAWKDKKFRKYNLMEPVPPLFAGKRQPYIQFLNTVRQKLVQLGFQELYSPSIVTEFYNFDVLFQPQNHPARTWTDTYKLKRPMHGQLPEKKMVKAVKAAHEFGGVSASQGWQYSWSEIIASQLMPAAHATAYTGMRVAQGLEVPGKYFALARCYRPDVLDATHLLEFNQLDGIVVGEDLNFRHLLGILKEFAIEIAGAEKVRFYPDYYPFTEPSVQLSAKHPDLGWIEFAGAGIFRPEMTENLGVKEPVLAWGMGADRLAMFKLGIKDIRYLFSDDLNWLRQAPLVRDN